MATTMPPPSRSHLTDAGTFRRNCHGLQEEQGGGERHVLEQPHQGPDDILTTCLLPSSHSSVTTRKTILGLKGARVEGARYELPPTRLRVQFQAESRPDASQQLSFQSVTHHRPGLWGGIPKRACLSDRTLTFQIHPGLEAFPEATGRAVLPPDLIDDAVVSPGAQVVVLACGVKTQGEGGGEGGSPDI